MLGPPLPEGDGPICASGMGAARAISTILGLLWHLEAPLLVWDGDSFLCIVALFVICHCHFLWLGY